MPEERLRCFVALPLDKRVKGQLAEIQEELKQTGAEVKWVEVDHIHLTLKFLGHISLSQVDLAKAGLKEALRGFSPFEFILSEIGAFPRMENPRVLWIGVREGKQRVLDLQKKIEKTLEEKKFPEEERPFHPHLTLGRVRSKKNIAQLGEKLKSVELPKFESIKVDRIILFQSVLKPTGPTYLPLSEFKLAPIIHSKLN